MEFESHFPLVGSFDLAQLTLYLFWAFFAGLIIYLQRENMREGYPLVHDDGKTAWNQGPLSVPDPKTFKLPHGRGEVAVPNDHPVDDRPIALEQTSAAAGSPFVPTGDPMADGVGPASWCMRRDEPELDGHGHNKIQPMSAVDGFAVSAGKDPRGMPVVSADGETVGTVTDMWVDVPEHLVRYLEYDLGEAGKRLIPIQLANFYWSDKVNVHSLYAGQFAGVPTTASGSQITLLEEEKICAYYCGGKLYADPQARLEPLLG
ncbi:MAG: photosynthetic reaction center subunit H [Pseudomonadota bacterium]